MKVWCAVIARWEEPYIREWLDWNKSIGIHHILLADNNDDDRLIPVIQDYIDYRYVDVYDYRGMSTPQMHWYNHALYIAKYHKIDWLALIDVDEFIITDSVTHMLDGHSSTFSLPWRIYDDNNQLYYEDRPVRERFTRTVSWAKSGMTPCKSIWYVASTDQIQNQHKPQTPLSRNMLLKEDYSGSYIAHYMFKSTQEYAMKARRGRVFSKAPRYTKDNYFKYNIWTEEKDKVFDRYATLC